MGSWWARIAVVLAAAVPVVLTAACGTDAVGIESCRKIEEARCENAPSCGIALESPVHRGDTPERNVIECKRYYDDACMHGLTVSSDPGSVAVQACIDAINAGSCSVVKNPELSPACSFLAVPDAGATDAGIDADAAETGS